jgi:hypothetical protein
MPKKKKGNYKEEEKKKSKLDIALEGENRVRKKIRFRSRVH